MEEIISSLKEVAKSNLISVVEYGKQEKQYVIFLETIDAPKLKSIKLLIEKNYKKTGIAPLLLTKEELVDGLDVFPLEFLNMKLNHNVLYGKDLLQNLKFEKKQIRRQLEFEFRSKLINLRQGYLEAASKKQHNLIIQKAIPTLLPILNGLLFLKGTEIPESVEEIIGKIGEKYKIETTILIKLNNKKEANQEDSITDLINFLSALSNILDEMKV